MLLAATLIFHTALNYMIDNIQEFETVPLPPKKFKKISTQNPTIEVNAKENDSWALVDFSTRKIKTINEKNASKSKLQNIEWDLGFSRTKIITNSGATNPLGKTGVINLGPVDFESVNKAPKRG